jgi:hypothetical protein
MPGPAQAPAPAPIDLSGGFVPISGATPAPTPTGDIDLSGGFVPKEAPATTNNGTTVTPPSTLQQVGQQALNVGKGVAEGAGQTALGIRKATDYVGNKIGDVIGLPKQAGPDAGVQAMDRLTTPTTTGEKVGVGLEGIGEFIMGDEALKGALCRNLNK